MHKDSDVDELQSAQEINTSQKHPFQIVWTTIPVLSWVCPCVGHVGIGDSTGIIHDFVGSCKVSIDDFAFGEPYKFVQLNFSDAKALDASISKSDDKFRSEQFSLCCNNCHSYVADVLSRIEYRGNKSIAIIDICKLVTCNSKYVSRKYKLKVVAPLMLAFTIGMIFIFYNYAI